MQRHLWAMKILAAILTAAALAAGATAAVLATTLTLTATPTTVAYGKSVALNGVLSTHRANQNVKVNATECGQTASKTVATVKTNSTGAYTLAAMPTINTTYQSTQKNTKSPTVAVTVAPLVKLQRVKRGSYTVSVTSAADLKGKAILFQRYSKKRKRWVQVKRVLLTTTTPGTKPTMVSSVGFNAKVAKGLRVRAAISKAQAAPCYVAAASNSLRA
jgi:hypothetical protein